MKHFLRWTCVLGLLLLTTISDSAGWGGRGGGGGGRGGGGGGARPAPPARSAAGGPYGAAGARQSTATQAVGPRGGTGQTHSGSGSVTTKGGSTVNYKGAGAGGTTAGGVKGGKYVGGVQVTTPGGQTATKVGRGGGAVGPNGNAAGGRGSVTKTTGPAGTGTAASRSSTAVGPGGAVHSRSGVAVGPNGAVAGRGAVATGARGTVAAGTRTGVTRNGTYYRSSAVIGNQGAYVRNNFGYYHCFNPGWYRQYPGAWVAAGLTAAAIWSTPSWGSVSSYCGYGEDPTYYNYGSNVVVQDGYVYYGGEQAYTEEQFSQQAADIASVGKPEKAAKGEDWKPLGVFAMVQGEEETSHNLFQLAINKQGIIRGNYYNALTDSDEPVRGSVDKKLDRAAWTVADRSSPVYEAGIANLTKDQTSMLVHYGKGKTQQWTLVRIEKPKDESPSPDKGE